MRLGAGRRVVARSWSVLAVALAVIGFGGGAQAQEATAAEPTPSPSPTPAPAAPKRTYEVRPTTAKIAVDGVLDEAPWQEAPTFTLDYETYPADNAPPPVKTEFWLTYDERGLYVAVRAQDPEPAKIRARLRDRDAAFSDDFVGVVLDTFNDERRAFEFFVNPLGVQMDMFQNDVTGNEDAAWDALWASAGRLTATGYEVEMAIPFSSLRFTREAGTQTWGIDAVRVWPRDQRRRIGLNALPRGRNCYLCFESKLTGFEGITPGRNFELDPTLTANQTRARADSSEPYDEDEDVEPGLTARWGVTPGMTLNAAINPDFSQVEADAAQLAVNTQFALFFPEKRPFFLEGADLFETRINAIYTRNIADPAWGLKVTGKEGKNAFGAIVAQDTRTNLLIPSSQFSQLAFLDEENTSTILRYRRDLGGAGSAVGGLVTSREGRDYHNRVVGLDGLIRWGEGHAFRVEVLGSDTRYPATLAADTGQPLGSLRGHSSRLVYQGQSREYMGYLQYQDASDDFRADLGFIPQVGYQKGYGIYEKYWYADHGEHWWTRWTCGRREHVDLRQRRQPAAAPGVALLLVQRAHAVVRAGLPRPRRQLLRRPLLRPQLRRLLRRDAARRDRSTSTSTGGSGRRSTTTTRGRGASCGCGRRRRSTPAATCCSTSPTTTRRSTCAAGGSSASTSPSCAPPTRSTCAPSCASSPSTRTWCATPRSTPSR